MTLKEILFKLFKSEIKKYKLFVLCNVASIAILYSFISILENKQFMNYSIVDPMISSNIYAPTFLVLMFTGIFIPYSQSVFIKARQKDYGILLTIGMTENEVRNNVLIENLIMCILSLVIGLILGTFLSLFFLFFTSNVIGIDNIDITISISSYKITTIYVSVIFIISLIFNVYGIMKSSVLHKIKYTVKAESGKYYNIIFVWVGIVFTIAAFIVMILFYHVNSNIWFLSLLLCILGSGLIFFNGEALIEYFQNHHYKRYIKDILVFSDIKYYYGKNKKVFFVTVWIFFTILFFVTFSLITYPNLSKNAMTYHPFHMVYGEIEGSLKPLGHGEIESIALNNGNSITSDYAVEFVRNNVFTIFCVDDINRLLKKDYEIKSNSFMYVYPYDINDGYGHNIDSNIPSIGISDFKGGTKKFITQEIITDPLLGRVNCVSEKIILVNKEDYEWIALNGIDYYVKGTLHLYNFHDWRKSTVIVNEVWNKLLEKNDIEEGDAFYKISSRIDAYNKALKSSDFLIFNFTYVSLLLYFAAIVMMHFKFKMEYKDEKKKYFNLYRIGISEIEIKKIISPKILIIYAVPCVYAIIMNIGHIYYINSSYGYGLMGILYALVTSLVFLIIHIIFYRLYFISYYKKIILELNTNFTQNN